MAVLWAVGLVLGGLDDGLGEDCRLTNFWGFISYHRWYVSSLDLVLTLYAKWSWFDECRRSKSIRSPASVSTLPRAVSSSVATAKYAS